MKVWTDLSEIPGDEKSVVTIGNFDGMHNGHRRVVASCVERARKRGVDAVAITFDPHPTQVHRPEVNLQLISPLRDRLDAMASCGLDATLVERYDQSVYTLEPEEFVTEYLVDRLGAVEVVVGEDFRFGAHNLGTIDTLRALGRTYGFDVAGPHRGCVNCSPKAMSLALPGFWGICTESVARSNTVLNEAVPWDSRPPICRAELKALCLLMACMPAGLCVPFRERSPQNSCPQRSRWEQTHSLMG